MSVEYGGTAEAFAWWRGRLVPGARIRLWTDRTQQTQITDLFTVEGEQITGGFVRADDAGWYRFATGADYQSIYAEMVGGDGRLYRLDRADVGTRVFGLESDVRAAQHSAAEASATAATAAQKADEAHSRITGELAGVNTPDGLLRLNSFGKVGAAYLPADSSASSFLTWADYPMPDAENWPSPVGYRGMANTVPENTLEGIRAYLDLHPMIPDQQVPVVWLNVTTTDEGAALVLRADVGDSVTTTRPYYVFAMSAGTARMARVSGRAFHPGWPDLAVPTLDDVLAEFAGRMLFVLEVNESDNTISHVWQTVKNYGMEASVIIADYYVNAGRWVYYDGAMTMAVVPAGETITDAELGELAAEGITWVALHCAGVNPSNGAAQFAYARSVGLNTCAYPLTRHYELDRIASWGSEANPYGADMYVSPDPVYAHWQKTRHKAERSWYPPWETETYSPGQLGNGPGVDAVDAQGRPIRHQVFGADAFTPRSGFAGYLHVRNDPGATNAAEHRLDPTNLAAFWEHQGWCSPNVAAAGRMQDIATLIHFRRGSPATWATIAFGMSDDRPFQYQGTLTTVLDGPPGQNGWVLVIRPDGALYLRKVTDGLMSATDDAGVNTGPGAITPGPGPGGILGVRVRLTPTQVIAELKDTAGAVQRTLTFDDASAAHRGGYIAFGSRHGELLFTSTEVGTRTIS